jgi:hypothetical protein
MDKGTLAFTIDPCGRKELVRIIDFSSLYDFYKGFNATPLIWQELFVHDHAYECEFLNGSGTCWLTEQELEIANPISVAKWKLKSPV